MQVFHDAFFDDKVEFNGASHLPGSRTRRLCLFPPSSHHPPSPATGDVLDILEARHDWAKMVFTPELFKYVLTQMLPEVILHSKSQDEEQVRDHYDSTFRVVTCHYASLTTLHPLQGATTSTDGLLFCSSLSVKATRLTPVIQVPWPPHDLHLWHRSRHHR